MRLGSPAPALIPLPFPIARETKGALAVARLALWATFTGHHAKFNDRRLSRRAWIVRLMTLLLLALVVLAFTHLPPASPHRPANVAGERLQDAAAPLPSAALVTP